MKLLKLVSFYLAILKQWVKEISKCRVTLSHNRKKDINKLFCNSEALSSNIQVLRNFDFFGLFFHLFSHSPFSPTEYITARWVICTKPWQFGSFLLIFQKSLCNFHPEEYQMCFLLYNVATFFCVTKCCIVPSMKFRDCQMGPIQSYRNIVLQI